MKANLIQICHWEITKRCNLACIHCISSTGDKSELNTNEAFRTINILGNFGCKELYITGGEPLVREDIFEIFKKAKEKGFKVGLLTNGLLINKTNIKKIKSFVDEIGISLDGPFPQINDKIRGRGTFKKILRIIKILKFYQIPLTIYVTISKINLEYIESILNLISDLKIEKIRINEVSLRGRAYKNRSLLGISKERKKNLKDSLLGIFKKHFPQFEVRLNKKCEANRKTIFLSPLGYIYPCIEIFQRKSSCHLGNIRECNFKRFLRYRKVIFKDPKIKCPYEEFRGNNFSALLNDSFIKKCPLEERIYKLQKLIH